MHHLLLMLQSRSTSSFLVDCSLPLGTESLNKFLVAFFFDESPSENTFLWRVSLATTLYCWMKSRGQSKQVCNVHQITLSLVSPYHVLTSLFLSHCSWSCFVLLLIAFERRTRTLFSVCLCPQIIFSSKKRNCDKLAQAAWDRGFAVDSLHGDREQWERTKVTTYACLHLPYLTLLHV